MNNRSLGLAFVTLALLSFVYVFDHELWTPDEPRDAEVARETGFGAIPMFNGEAFLEKPPLYYWTVAASYRVFGVSAWASRIPSILFGWGTLLMTALLARRMYGREAAINAALVLGTTLFFFLIGHRCAVDNALVFFTTATFYWLHVGLRAERNLVPYVVAYCFALGAFLTKGFIGLALVAPAYLAFLLWTRNSREILRARPWLALLIVGAGAALWLMMLTPELRRVFLIDNHIDRFTGGDDYQGGHVRPAWFYLLNAPGAFLPWILALVPAVPWAFAQRDDRDSRFLLCWIFVGVAITSLATTKRMIYVMPLLPGAAILVGAWFERVPVPPRWARASLAALGVLLIAAQFAVFGLGVALYAWLGLAGAIAVAAAAWFATRSSTRPIRYALSAASILVGVVFIAVPALDAAKSLRPFCERLPRTGRIAASGSDETTQAVIPFYTGMLVEDATADAPSLVVTKKRKGEPTPSGYTVVFQFDPPPLRLFGRKAHVERRSLAFATRSGATVSAPEPE